MASPAAPPVTRRLAPRRGTVLLGWSLAGVLLLTALGLAVVPRLGGAPSAPPAPAADPAEVAAVRVLRARLRSPDAAEFRGVRVFPSADGGERAVCGRILAPDLPGGAVEFVARVLLRGGERPGTQPMVILEEGPGVIRATAGAQQRYCRIAPPPGALPAPAPPADSAPLLSERLPRESLAGASMPVVASQGGGLAPPLGAAVVRTPANLRAGPGGGAPVLSTLPRGLAVTVFGRAPGGWLQVGDTAPWGWVHASLMADQQP
jgi:hypothetical protein